MIPWWLWLLAAAGLIGWCWVIISIQREVNRTIRSINKTLATRPDLWPWFREKLDELGLLEKRNP